MSIRDRLGIPFRDGQLAVPESGSTVVWNGSLRPFYGSLPRERAYFVQGDWVRSQRFSRDGFRTGTTNTGLASLAIVEINRSRKATLGLIGIAYSGLETGGTLVIDGKRDMGIDGILNAVRSRHPVNGSISKQHGRVFWLTRHGDVPGDFRQWKRLLEPRRNGDGFFTVPNLFSSEAVDPGSALLADALSPIRGHGADFGSGWGWLSAQALANNPGIASLSLIDCESEAIKCARLNVRDNRARFTWADVMSCTFDRKLDFVLMNPPFHRTTMPDPGLGIGFVRRAAAVLHSSGSLHLVANRHLPYEETVKSCFRSWRTVSEANGFKTIRARNPRLRIRPV